MLQTSTTPADITPRSREAARLMLQFADRTGLTSGLPVTRYLWTDAFAVCNFLGLARAMGDGRYIGLALRLIDQVHHTLGRHRPDDPRAGWISGLGDSVGATHPTLGGLRIGKRLPERRAGEPFDEQLEWDRDGQYFHYLTQWMHALDQASRATGQSRFNLWARELAETAYRSFSRSPPRGGRPRLVWKMSIDLSRPLVSSTGAHDAVNGFVACTQLTAGAAQTAGELHGPTLEKELAGLALMSGTRDWVTSDPLGIGGLLVDACRFEQLRGAEGHWDAELFRSLLAAGVEGLRRYARRNELQRAVSERLAFRELGLAIGLHAVELLERRNLEGTVLNALLGDHRPWTALGSTIEACWQHPAHQQSQPWREHRDINEVMLATSLAPEGYFVLGRSS